MKLIGTLFVGLKSRFELINFDDFDEEELKTIWNEEIKSRHFECDECVTSVVASRLVKSAGRKGFGNARAVRKEARFFFDLLVKLSFLETFCKIPSFDIICS
jgi:hypothetical protein